MKALIRSLHADSRCCIYSSYLQGHLLNNSHKATTASTLEVSLLPTFTHGYKSHAQSNQHLSVQGFKSSAKDLRWHDPRAQSHYLHWTATEVPVARHAEWALATSYPLFFFLKYQIPFSHLCSLTSHPQLPKKRCSNLTVCLCSLAHSRAPMYRPSNCAII